MPTLDVQNYIVKKLACITIGLGCDKRNGRYFCEPENPLLRRYFCGGSFRHDGEGRACMSHGALGHMYIVGYVCGFTTYVLSVEDMVDVPSKVLVWFSSCITRRALYSGREPFSGT